VLGVTGSQGKESVFRFIFSIWDQFQSGNVWPFYYEASQPVISAVTWLYILPRENLCNYSHFVLIITLQLLRPLLNAMPLVTAGNTQVILFSALQSLHLDVLELFLRIHVLVLHCHAKREEHS
jgi:hypothetical protein